MQIISDEVKINIINYLSGNWDDCDSSILNFWLEANESNRSLFRNLVELWEVDEMLLKEKDFDPDLRWQELELKMQNDPTPVIRLSITKKFIHYAAVFVLVFILGGAGYLFYQKHDDPTFSASNAIEYTVPYGSKIYLKLQDGSAVWLNAGSTLEYKEGYGLKNRSIKLQGEAYFEVAKNKGLPFIVETNNISVLALGTKFNVKAYPEEKFVSTILLEGSVKLQNLNGNQDNSIILEPNQKAEYTLAHNNFDVSEIQNTSEVSWFTDTWVIERKKLGEFTKMLERHYNVKFTFEEPSIREEYQFSGTIKSETINQVLEAITATSPLKYKIENRQIVLSFDKNKQSKYEKILK